MAIAPIASGDTDARAKINAAIAEANKVSGKAEQSALAAEIQARQQAVADVQQAISSKAAQSGLTAEIQARQQAVAVLNQSIATKASQQAVAEEATARAEADAEEATARAAGDAMRSTFGEAAGQHARPGEPGRFATADLSGAPDATEPLPDNLKVVSRNGAVVALQAGYVAPRAVYRIEPGRRYRVRFVFQRAQDTQDPANDAVRLGIAWLGGDKALLKQTVLADILDITVQSGRVEFNYALSRHDADDVDVVAPADAVYLRPFVRVYGSGLTHVEVIEFDDISNALEWAPDVGEFRRQLAGMEFNVTSLIERMDGAEDLLEQARDARFIKSGTLDDARLSSNVLLRDADQTITGDKTFEAMLRMLGALLLGTAARVTGDGDSFAIAPTNGAGGFDTLKEFGFNLPDGFWRFESGLRVASELRAGSLQATPIGATNPAAAKFTSVDFTDKPTTRTNLDVYSKAETDNRFETFDALVRKGAIDCSTNPNYPAANAGYVWIVSQPGKIGGASGMVVEAGDFLICNADSSPAGTQAAVGANWTVGQINIDVSAFARTLLDDPDAAAMRTTLGLTIGSQVQAYDALLQALAGLTTSSGKGLHFTGADLPALHDLTWFALTLLDDEDAETARATLGLVVGEDVQAFDSDLAAIAELAPADDVLLQRKAGGWVARTPRQVMADLRKQATVTTDADFTLTAGTSAELQRHTGALTADRVITLATAGAQVGDAFEIARSGSGAFNLSVGELKDLVTGSWCRVVFDGSAWYVAAAGSL